MDSEGVSRHGEAVSGSIDHTEGFPRFASRRSRWRDSNPRLHAPKACRLPLTYTRRKHYENKSFRVRGRARSMARRPPHCRSEPARSAPIACRAPPPCTPGGFGRGRRRGHGRGLWQDRRDSNPVDGLPSSAPGCCARSLHVPALAARGRFRRETTAAVRERAHGWRAAGAARLTAADESLPSPPARPGNRRVNRAGDSVSLRLAAPGSGAVEPARGAGPENDEGRATSRSARPPAATYRVVV